MNSSKYLFLFIFLFALTSCKSQITIPKNLDEAILYFQQHWTKSQLKDFQSKAENKAVGELHFETGLWIRNNWVHGDRDTILRNYFKTIGIYAPDDISSIILNSLHRRLNKKNIELYKQVEIYKAFWQPITDCNKKQKAKAISDYNKFKVDDTITILMPVDTANGSGNAIFYDCPTPEWTFDKGKDLILKGSIINKFFINDKTNVFFTIQIGYLNRPNIEILMTKVKVGDKKDFSITGLTIE